MKKVVKVVNFLLIVMLLSGCMNYQFNMTINSDKSVDMKINLEMNLLEFVNSALSEDGLGSTIRNEIIKSTCTASCPYDDTNCIDACVASADTSVDNANLTEEELKEYLDEYLNSEEFSEEEFFDEESRKKLEEKGYNVETNLDKENYIFQASIYQKFNSIDELSSNNDIVVNLDDLTSGTLDENVFFTKLNDDTYKAHFIWETDLDANESYGVNISELITVNYIVNLPFSSISNNATNVTNDNKTLSWNIDFTQNNDIQYEFSFVHNDTTNVNKAENDFFVNNKDTLKIISFCLIGGGIIGLVIVVVILLKSRKY